MLNSSSALPHSSKFRDLSRSGDLAKMWGSRAGMARRMCASMKSRRMCASMKYRAVTFGSMSGSVSSDEYTDRNFMLAHMRRAMPARDPHNGGPMGGGGVYE